MNEGEKRNTGRARNPRNGLLAAASRGKESDERRVTSSLGKSAGLRLQKDLQSSKRGWGGIERGNTDMSFSNRKKTRSVKKKLTGRQNTVMKNYLKGVEFSVD